MPSNCPRLWILCATLTASAAAHAQGAFGDTLSNRQRSFGAGVAPAVLPAGSSAAYGFAGAPEIGGGYRQGLGPLEFEARGYFDYFLIAAGLDLRTRWALPPVGPVEFAPIFGTGVVFDSGATYIDEDNFSFWGIRALAGMMTTYRVVETVSLIGEVELPLDFAVDPAGGKHFSPKLGGGAEFHLGGDVSAFVLGKLGLDVLKEPLGVTQNRLGFQLRVGLGWRLF